ncbi:Putative antibiotic biosynthesis monooxygenase domain-containing protein [Septoria linicola]|uniref:Antibiotic biosynthesis monooxygenase domain-containing protein n=1 Tax=Septoria linicola TaxID=215465 RepID=A0A9Q9B0S8_9PEZI|nr:Putative antibiotic biosynthesis monooxygenase domain-containing protein [Septoria linicola]
MAAKQLTLFVTFKIQPDRIEEFKEAHRPVWAACAAEPECLFFDVFQDPQAPGTFRFVEIWSKDREWFEKEQFTKPYYATLWPKSEPTWAAPVEVEYFERTGDGSTYRKEFLNLGTRID